MLIAENLKRGFGSLQVLKGVNLEVKSGEVISISGRSGAGKSTLLHILGTLDRADSGRLWIDGKEITQLNDGHMSRFRNQRLGFVFQFHHLLPEFTALENIGIPLMIAGKSTAEVESRGMELLKLLDLKHRAHHKPDTLSGGEQQRVAVARALANAPAVIFADEPSGNLDAQTAAQLHSLFFDLRDKLGQTFILVTHNSELAEMADRNLVMADGQIVP
ncbi:MAG: ABC transporter ATP-binding protein [Bacteroidetes bacterium]|nr:ABC transporter ATP-binding protein [Bacteroidota bacterium]